MPPTCSAARAASAAIKLGDPEAGARLVSKSTAPVNRSSSIGCPCSTTAARSNAVRRLTEA